jgi:hypothetical protein
MGNKSANETEYKAVIDIALVALKSAILINGGAAIAMLAFWGTALGVKPDIVYSSNIASALGFFAQGVLSGGLATLPAYLSQVLYSFHSHSSMSGNILRVIAFLLVGCFWWGQMAETLT